MSKKLNLSAKESEFSLFPDEDEKLAKPEQGSFQVTVSKSKSPIKTELIKKIQEINALEADTLAFMPRATIYAAMPYRRQYDANKKPLLVYERTNNFLTLKLQSIDENLGIPSGAYPRILIAYMSTQAMRTKSPYIELPQSIYALLGDLGLNTHGSIINGFRTQLDALRKSFYYIEWNSEFVAGNEIYRIKKDHMSPIIEDSVVWDKVVGRGKKQVIAPSQDSGYYVKLSNSFFQDICNNPVPIDMRAMASLLNRPLAMDLYTWFTHQASFLRYSKIISWEAMNFQFGSFSRLSDFKKACIGAIKEVLSVYPALRVCEVDHGIQLLPSPTHVPRTLPMKLDVEKVSVSEKSNPVNTRSVLTDNTTDLVVPKVESLGTKDLEKVDLIEKVGAKKRRPKVPRIRVVKQKQEKK